MTDIPRPSADFLSLVVPFYNESEGITRFTEAVLPVLDSVPSSRWEIVCVDDGSRDGTLGALIETARRDARFQVLELSRNFGKEAAMSAGIDAALGDAVVIIDADLQDPPELIPEMVERWRDGADVVLGRRAERSSDSYLKQMTAGLFYRLHNRLAQVKIPQNVGDFRLMDRSVADALRQLPERQRFMKGLFAWVGFRTVTVDYARPARAEGKTKFSPVALWNLAIEGLTSFSTLPIRLWTYIGTAGALLALLYGTYILVRTVIEGSSVPGYASLFVAVTFFGSIQIISIGMLGEYIGRIYMETKQRPLYVVRRTYGGAASPAADGGP